MSSDKRKVNYVAAATVILVLYTISLSMLASAKSSSLQNDSSISNVGAVKAIGVGVYYDANLTSGVSSIDWGVLEPGLISNETVYVRNEANSSIRLALVTSNWAPSNAAQFITLEWDYGGESIAPGLVVKVTLELTVSANISNVTNFSFDVSIVGT